LYAARGESLANERSLQIDPPADATKYTIYLPDFCIRADAAPSLVY